MTKAKRGGASGWLVHPLLIVWALLQLYPIFWLIISSLKPSAEIQAHIFALPRSLYLDNYNFGVFNQRGITIATYLVNSAIVTVASIVILTVVSLLAGYAIAKLNGPGKNLIIILLVGMLGIPVHSLIIPLYYFIAKAHLLSNFWGLILPYVAFYLPFSILLLQTYFRDFPNEIIEAAKIDGCNKFRVFSSIVMPVSMGGISTVLIINFLNVWNEFLFSLVIMKSNAAKTLPVGLMSFRGQYNVDWGPMLAAMFLASLPPIVFYLVFHQNIIKGMTAGSLKG